MEDNRVNHDSIHAAARLFGMIDAGVGRYIRHRTQGLCLRMSLRRADSEERLPASKGWSRLIEKDLQVADLCP